MAFEQWLGDLLGQTGPEIHSLLADRSALHFLIVWSLFESKCFDGFAKMEQVENFARRVVSEGFDTSVLAPTVSSFHVRYQDANLYGNLMHQKKHNQVGDRMNTLIETQLETFTAVDRVFFIGIVVHRFRNNIFHGNKGVQSWLHYSPQIALCTEAMEYFVSHAESVHPSLPERHAT